MENPYAPTHPEIRDAVRQLCLKFDGAYWRELDRERGYPTEFVQGADRGRLARDPDPRGVWRLGARHLGGGRGAGGSAARRLQRRRLPRPDVHHGHAAAARQQGAEGALPAQDRQRRVAPAGVRRHRADQRHRHAGAAHDGGEEGQQHLRRERPEGVDQPRRAFRPDAAAGAHHAARAGQEAHRGPVGLPGRHARDAGQGPHHPADPHHDEPQQHRSVLRQHGGAGREPDRRGRAGLPLHPERHERRARADRRRDASAIRAGSSRRRRTMPRSASCSAGRSARTRACSSRSRAPMRRPRRPT